MTVRDDAPFRRDDLVRHLNSKKIDTRLLFGGNLVHQPYMAGRNFRSIKPLTNSDRVMRDTFWIGVYPGINQAQIDYVSQSIHTFISKAQQ